MAEEEAHLKITASDESLARALESTDAHLKETQHELGEMGRAGLRAGEELKTGMDQGQSGTQRARNALGQFIPVAHAAGSAASGAGAKAAAGAVGFTALAAATNNATKASKKGADDTSIDKLAGKLGKLSKTLGGIKPITMLFKWGTILAGGQAIVGMLTSLAAGGVMAVARLAPMVGVLGALGPALFLGAGMMAIFKISGMDVGAILRPLTNDIRAMRYEITQAMVPGLQAFNREIHDRLMPTLKTGLVGMAGSFATAAKNFGAMITNARTVGQIGTIFRVINPIVAMLGNILGRVFNVFINLAFSALPMFRSMADGADRLTTKFQAWSNKMTDSGRATAFMNRAWEQAKSAGHTLWNTLVALYNIFTIAGQAARVGFGGGLASASQRFRDWTQSAKGADSIRKFFDDAIPVLRETGRILAYLAEGFAHFGNSPQTAKLLEQIRTQLLPALGNLINNFSGQGGLGPALVSAISGIAQALSQIPLGGLTLILQAVAALAGSIAWLVANVPGLGPAIGIFLTLWTVAGTGLKAAEMGVKAFNWISKAAGDSKDLSIAQKALGAVLKGVGPVLRTVGEGILFIGRAIAAAFMANPFIAILVLFVGALVFMWFKFDWFRNGIMTGLKQIGDFFVWIWDGIKWAVSGVWDFIKWVYNGIAKGWNAIPDIKIPDVIPVIGGTSFGLPKLPLLAKGGVVEYGMAIVGEQGPEALVAGGKLLGMVGTSGPELRTDLPRGSYVVPSPGTIASGMFHSLPDSVVNAVAEVPGYGELLNRPSAAPGAPQVDVRVDTGGAEVVEAVDRLTAALTRRPPPGGDDKAEKLLAAVLRDRRQETITNRYRY